MIYKCEICQKENIKNIGNHVYEKHKIHGKEYYDKYLLKNNENLCKICKKEKSFSNCNIGYAKKYCSVKCAKKDIEFEEKRKLTLKNKFNTVCGWQFPKTKDSIYKNFGVDSPLKSKEILKKVINTNLKKYKVKYQVEYNRDKKFKKIKKSNLKKYGVELPLQSLEIQNKTHSTCFKKYGVLFPLQCKKILHKTLISGSKIKKHSCGLDYMSSYEKHFIDFCIKNNIQLQKPPFFEYEFNGSRRYFPDFIYKPLNLIIEIKSTYYYNKFIEKNFAKEDFVKQSNYNYILILDKNYNEFLNLINKE